VGTAASIWALEPPCSGLSTQALKCPRKRGKSTLVARRGDGRSRAVPRALPVQASEPSEAGGVMASLAQFIKHGQLYGGYSDIWEVARKELHALELGTLVKALRGMPARHRGGDGRTIERRFALTRRERVALIERLMDAGADDPTIRGCVGVSQSEVGSVRRNRGLDPPESTDLGPVPQGHSRNEVENRMTRPSPAVDVPRSPDSRTCEQCLTPLPFWLKVGARYCQGGACKQAAYRSRKGALAAQGGG
jgi:hypothetical protein